MPSLSLNPFRKNSNKGKSKIDQTKKKPQKHEL